MRVSKIILIAGAYALLPMSAHAKFVSPDPVGFKEGGVDYFNRYAYVANDPVNATDPTGAVIEINGSDEDLQRFTQVASDLTGLNVGIENGRLTASGNA